MSAIINGVEFKCANDITFTKPKINASGGKNVGVLNKHTMKGLYINTPLMLTWGINEYKDEVSGKVSYDMSLQFPNEEYNTPELTDFLKNMREFEDMVKQAAIKNSKEWMNKSKMSEEVVDALWTPILKYPKDKNGEPDYSRAPTMKVKIPFWEGVIKNVEVYNTNQELVFPHEENLISDFIVKGSHVATIIQCGGVWFANGKFGMTWRLFQCMVKPKQSLAGKCHIMISETERQKLVIESEKDSEAEAIIGGEEVEVVEDTDDEEIEETIKQPAPEPAPEPAPAPQPQPEPVKELQVDDAVKPKKNVVKKTKPIEAEAEA